MLCLRSGEFFSSHLKNRKHKMSEEFNDFYQGNNHTQPTPLEAIMNREMNEISPAPDLHLKYKYLQRSIIILSFIFILFVIWTVYDNYTYRGEMEDKYYKGLLELQKREKQFNKQVDRIASTLNLFIKQLLELKYPEGLV